MDIKTQANSVKLVSQIFDRKKARKTVIPYKPQKPEFNADLVMKQPFARATPESTGMASEYIAAFLAELEADPSLDMHTVTVLKDGKIISEASFGSYDTSVWHTTYSECKSITSLAVGMLIDEGKLTLEDRVVDIFSSETPKAAKIILKDLTVKHLLTMSSVLFFNETGSVTEQNWVKCFLESIPKGEFGKRFEYNSMNTYMLAAIVNRLTGQTLTEYLKPRLFEPLGIENFYWETCPKGVEKAGWGLYIIPEDLAKIGQLILNKGLWEGKRIISEEYLSDAVSEHMKAPEEFGAHNYGYQIWVGRNENTFLFNGMFGQNMIGFTDKNILIVSNAGNDEFFQNCSFFDIVYKYFGGSYAPKESLPPNRAALKALRLKEDMLYKHNYGFFENMRKKKYFLKAAAQINDSCYIFPDNEASTVSILPLVVQAVQNNYGKGLDKLCFYTKNGTPYIAFSETDETYEFALLFNEPYYCTHNFHGEPYRVACDCLFTKNEDDIPVLKIRLSYLELAGCMNIKIFFFDGKVSLHFVETPGKDYVTGSVLTFARSSLSKGIFDALEGKIDAEGITQRIKNSFEPEIEGFDEK